MPAYLLHQLLRGSAERRPEQECIVHEVVRATYGDILAGASRVARVLLAEGLRRGDRVGLLAHNSTFFVECYFGILMAGGCVVPINTAVDAKLLSFYLHDAGVRILFAGCGLERVLVKALREIDPCELVLTEATLPIEVKRTSARVVDLGERCAAERGEPPAVRLVDQDLACIVYTSGSTGRPRGATLTHLNCLANTRAVVSYLELTPADRVLGVLPFYYIYGKSVLDTHVAAGGTLVVENRFLYPQVALETLDNERCTGFSGVPSTFAILLNRSNFAERHFEHLRYVTQAGGAMSPALIRRLMEVLPDKKIYIMYGATEAAGRLSYLPPEDLPKAVGAIGRAIDNVELRVLRPDGGECAVGETGEIVARGSCIMRGYWNDPEETAKVLDEHGYHTGDLGCLREDGYLAVVGRSKDMIKAGAHRVSPKEIEEALLESGQVHEAAVIGVPDEILGEAICAYIVPISEAPSIEMLERFLAERLPAYKLPATYEVRQQLPKNESGKIMKEALRQERRRATGPSAPASAQGAS